MSSTLNYPAFKRLVDEDIAWLEPLVGHALEGRHTLEILRWSATREAYDAMTVDVEPSDP